VNRYLIQKKIRTTADLGEEFEYAGFMFVAFEPDKGLSDEAWLAERKISADTYQQAVADFQLALVPIIDALSILTQCSFSILAADFLVYRLNENENRTFYLYVARDRKPVGMPFWPEKGIKDLESLARVPNSFALHYLRESNNATTLKTRLAMLVIAAEALAGVATKERRCKCGRCTTYSATDMDRVENIVGSQVHQRLYRGNGGALRHKLFHGSHAPEDHLGAIIGPLYDAILDYLRRECGLLTVEKIVNAPRTFGTTFKHGDVFLQPEASYIPHLRSLKHWPDCPGYQIVATPTDY